MAAGVTKALLNDPEDLDLLVGSESHLRIDVELDGELTVGGQDLHVAAQ